jgi:hypothetical protein
VLSSSADIHVNRMKRFCFRRSSDQSCFFILPLLWWMNVFAWRSKSILWWACFQFFCFFGFFFLIWTLDDCNFCSTIAALSW